MLLMLIKEKILRFILNACLLFSGLTQDVIEQIIQSDKITFPKSIISSNNFSIEWDLTVNVVKYLTTTLCIGQ